MRSLLSTLFLLPTVGCAFLGGVDGEHELRCEERPEGCLSEGEGDGGQGGTDPNETCAGCTTTFLDCDDDRVAETDITSEANSCGGCGLVCESGTCDAGACLLGEVPGALSFSLAVVDDTLFATDIQNHVVWKLSTRGAHEPEWFQTPDSSKTSFTIAPHDLTVANGYVWWVGRNGLQSPVLMRAKPDGTVIEEVWALDHPTNGPSQLDWHPHALAIREPLIAMAFIDDNSETHLFWGLTSDPAGMTEFAVSSEAVGPLHFMHEGSLIWFGHEIGTDVGTAFRWTAPLGLERLFEGEMNPRAVKSSGDHLVWLGSTSTEGHVVRSASWLDVIDNLGANTPPQTAETLSDHVLPASTLTVAHGHIYWCEAEPATVPRPPRVFRLPVDGGEREPVLSGAESTGYISLASDERYLYVGQLTQAPTFRVLRIDRDATYRAP